MKNIPKNVARVLRLPRLNQLGIVVRDMDRAIEYFSRTFGLGPWFRAGLADEEHYRGGTERVSYELDLVMAFSGGVMFELISHLKGDRNLYLEHLEKHGEGLHHLGFFVKDFDRRMEAVREAGIGVLQSGIIKSTGKGGGSETKYAYLDTVETGGIIFEYIQTKFVGITIKMSRPWFEMGALTGDLEKISIR
ncbi:MAG: VOC family protein [Deltaproteobacteria bacterium]|nr:VOC family protein [Candidatus Zymogenaceae bacterium]